MNLVMYLLGYIAKAFAIPISNIVGQTDLYRGLAACTVILKTGGNFIYNDLPWASMV